MKKLLLVAVFLLGQANAQAFGLSLANPETVGDVKRHYTYNMMFLYVAGVYETCIALQGVFEGKGMGWVGEEMEMFGKVIQDNLKKYGSWKVYIDKLLAYLKGLPASQDGDLLLRRVVYARF